MRILQDLLKQLKARGISDVNAASAENKAVPSQLPEEAIDEVSGGQHLSHLKHSSYTSYIV